MIALAIIGGLILALGLTMYTRGWIYFIKPDGKIAGKRKKRNLKMGWPTDMKVFGRKVRRVGFLTTLIGGGLVAWYITSLSGCASSPEAPARAPAGEDHAMKHEGGHHDFKGAEEWAKRFDNPERDAWQKPEAVLDMLELKPTDVVADLGAGTGYFVVRLSPKVPEGKVLGVDLEKEMVDYLTQRATDAGLNNVEGVHCTADDAKLPEPVDLVLVVNTYHHIGERTAYFERLANKLKPGGRVAIVDFKKGELPFGPPDKMKLSADAVEAELKAAGYTVSKRDDETLPHQYVVIFARAEG